MSEPATASPTTTAERFFGKYRGVVTQNVDPLQRGRVQAVVPDVLGLDTSAWAEACVPLAGSGGAPMGVYVVPPLGAAVWVEFEQGDPDYPIWSGCRWDSAADVPPQASAGLAGSPSIVLQTAGQSSLVISDLPGPTGGIRITSASGATLVVNDTGIHLDNGQGASVVLAGPTVDINAGALTVV
jgi:uncharacterized protein involved in type VI secretion and phage assembly